LELGKVPSGTKVKVFTDGGRKEGFNGTVGFVSPKAEFTPKSVETKELRTSLVYRVRVVVEDSDGSLRQGMPVRVTLGGPTDE
jgi:HlyD family secretion protein